MHLSFLSLCHSSTSPPSLNAALSRCNHSRLWKPLHTSRLLPDATTNFGSELKRCVRFMRNLLIHIRSQWSDRPKSWSVQWPFQIPFPSHSIRLRPYHAEHTDFPPKSEVKQRRARGHCLDWRLLGNTGCWRLLLLFSFNSKHDKSDFAFSFLISLHCISYLLSF